MSSKKRTPVNWTHKYSPTQLSELVGHTRTVRELREWLRNFGTSSPPVAFLYGGSGIGKTTLGTLLFRQYNYHIFELNAGEIRSKKRIKDLMDKILSNCSVSIMKRRTRQRTIAILFDEVDGLSCGDKGGLHQLFQMIAEQYESGQSVNPVICISNRPYDKKIAPYLYREISLRKPSTLEIFNFLKHVVHAEKVDCEDMALQAIIQHSGSDIRKCLNFLQEVTLCFPGDPIGIDTILRMQGMTHKKTTDCNIFDVTRAMFRMQRPFSAVYQLFRVDSNLIPMMMHENLPHQMQNKKLTTKKALPEYMLLMHNIALSDTLIDAVIVSDRSELTYSVSMLSCGYINERMPPLPKKAGAGPKTVFTNTLTKSATQSNTHNFISSLSYRLGVPSMYCVNILPIMVSQFIKDPRTLLDHNIDHNSLDKILQVYQKWTGKKIGTKDKRAWKTILQKRQLR